MECKIYWLEDSRTGEMRYVGQTTKDLKHRLNDHCKNRSAAKSHNARWIRQLKKCGLYPKIHLLQTLPDRTSLDEAEIYWIAHFRSLGCNLTNIQHGGRSNHNEFSVASRQKISIIHKGKKLSDEHKQKLSIAHIGKPGPNKGKKLTDEHKQKLSIAQIGKFGPNKGKKFTDEHKQKLSIAKKGKPGHNKGKKIGPCSDETKQKMSIAMTGKKLVDGHWKKLSSDCVID